MKPPVAPTPSYPLSPPGQAGVLVRSLTGTVPAAEHSPSQAHRDAHYLLVLLMAGELHLTLDFEQLTRRGPALLLVSPGQVHQLRGAAAPHGWGGSFEPGLMAEPLRELLARQLTHPLPLRRASRRAPKPCSGCSPTARRRWALPPHTGPTLQALLTALLHLVAGLLAPAGTTRGEALLAGFQRLLRQHLAEWKQLSQYAAALAVTTSHLNDTVKERSGSSVNQHLHARTVLEAKRLLYCSEQSVQQISYALGR